MLTTCAFSSPLLPGSVDMSDKCEQVEILAKDISEARSAFSSRLREGHNLLVRPTDESEI